MQHTDPIGVATSSSQAGNGGFDSPHPLSIEPTVMADQLTPGAAVPDRVRGSGRAAGNGPGVKWFNLTVKAALVVAFSIAIVWPPEAVEGKNMAARAPLFLGPAVVVPVLATVRRWRPYPHLADALVALPFLLDTLGNLLGFYDRFDATDDVLHFVNWVLLVMAFHAFRYRNVSDHRDAVLLGCGFGAIAIVVWEAFEWLISDGGPFAGDVPDALSLTYGDTVGDLVISSLGGLVGSLIGRYVIGPAIMPTAPADRRPDSARIG